MNNYLPARKISNRNGLSKVVGLFSSKKMNMNIAWESQLERDFCYLIEFDKNIINFYPQPKTFIFNFDGSKIIYTPDFYIEYVDSTFEYIEIKFFNSLTNPKTAKRLQLLNQYFRVQNINYRIIFDDEIRIQPKLNNIKFLHKYSKLDFEEKFYFNFDTTLESLSYLIDIKYIYAAMYNNFIEFDITHEISGNIKLSLRFNHEK